MKITGVLGAFACPSGPDCDFVYDTDDPEDVLVRGRFVTEVVTDPKTGAPLRLPSNEGLMRIKRSVLRGEVA